MKNNLDAYTLKILEVNNRGRDNSSQHNAPSIDFIIPFKLGYKAPNNALNMT